jgi:HTH domain
MTLIDQIHRLERLDQLIRMKSTGPPKNLARRLEISERTLYNLLDILRSMGAEIYFNSEKQSYYYPSNIEVEIKFKVSDSASATFKGGYQPFFNFSVSFFPEEFLRTA